MPDPVRAESLWFTDGNIVLQAGNTQFKVFHGILSARSIIFHDMLALPQPDDAEVIEGCPLVLLPDDENYAAAFLKAIYVPSSFPSFPNAVDIDAVLGCLRLSHKYDVEDLRRRALVHLSFGFSTTFDDWEKPASPHSEDLSPQVAIQRSSWDSNLKHYSVSQRLAIIRTARIVGALWILPHAFLQLSSHLAHDISLFAPFLSDAGEGESQLTSADAESFRAGHDIVTRDVVAGLMGSVTSPHEIAGCTDPARCLSYRLRTIGGLALALHTVRISFVNAFLAISLLKMPLCEECDRVVTASHQATRREFWDNLPSKYQLPNWEELEMMKAEAMGTNIFC
ncbi:hypothetical protein C8F01DRAFT_1137654 [Mycena amicta]|nr:hypothetical protein C8F01DRAFT_1137654 [Mycena amicta]